MVAVSTQVIPRSALDIVKKHPALYRFARNVRFGIGTMLGARTVPGVAGRVHYNDFMLESTRPDDVAHYKKCADDFVATLAQALAHCGRNWTDLAGVLEIGCGYGRIVRSLVSKVAPQRISVCDVIDEGAAFTAAEFGVRKVSPVGGTTFPGTPQFDLVYLLSVFTHLPADEITRILKAIDQAMRPGGVLVFTVHGQASIARLASYPPPWPERLERIAAALAATGEYYERYPYYKEEVGMAWHTPAFIRDLVDRACPSFRFVHFGAGEHDGHHDVLVFQKEGAPPPA